MSTPLVLLGGSRRPAPQRQAPLPPFDPNPDKPDQYYGGGNGVSTTLPPEFVAKWPSRPNVLALRADFNGVKIPGNYVPTDVNQIVAKGGVLMLDGPYAGTFIPFIPGANGTPPTMIMTPMLPLYPENIQVIVLTEHAKRGYSHIIWDTVPWNGAPLTSQQAIAFDKKLKSWGFFSYIWRGVPFVNDRVVQDVRAAGGCDFCGVGEEVDGKFDAITYEQSILVDYFKLGCPLAAHFTVAAYTPQNPSDQGAWPYNLRPQRDTFLLNWSLYNGKLHLALQSAQDAPAGLQASLAYYGRLHVNAGLGEGSVGPGAPDSRVYAFETMATAQLYGHCTEEYGNLRTWELLCAPMGAAKEPWGGFGNGCRRPDGTML